MKPKRRKESFPRQPGAPLGAGVAVGDLFTRVEMREISRYANQSECTVPALVHDLVLAGINKGRANKRKAFGTGSK